MPLCLPAEVLAHATGPHATGEANAFCQLLRKLREVDPEGSPLVLDGGADRGLFSRTALALNFTVLAVECRAERAMQLSREIKHARFAVVHACLGSTPGISRLHRALDSSSTVPRMLRGKAESWKAKRELHRFETSPSLPLDYLLSPRSLVNAFGPTAPTRVAVVKLDLQGAEGSALVGMRRAVRQHAPMYLFYEKQVPSLDVGRMLGMRVEKPLCVGGNCIVKIA